MKSAEPAEGRAENGGADRVAGLRGELWRRHALLHQLDEADPRYEQAVAEVLDLTAEFLVAEAEGPPSRCRLRRPGAGSAAAVWALGAAVLLGLGFYLAGGWPTWWAVAAIAPAVALAVSLSLRPQRGGAAAPRGAPSPS